MTILYSLEARPISFELTTGMTWVTPSPESITVPVNVLLLTCLDVHDAARANTACKTNTSQNKGSPSLHLYLRTKYLPLVITRVGSQYPSQNSLTSDHFPAPFGRQIVAIFIH